MRDQDETMQKPTSKRLTFAGFSLTIGYIVFVAWYWSDQSSSLAELKPNEFGDFLAGVFAPLAFLWLVLGFLQQGMELRNSADALWLQGEELKNSVEQQRSLVEVTREQLSLERTIIEEQKKEMARSSQPIFEFRAVGSMSAGNGMFHYRFAIFNHGQNCSDVRVVWGDTGQTQRHGLLATGNRIDISREMLSDSEEDIEISIFYIDKKSIDGLKKIKIRKNRSEFSTIENDEDSNL